MDIKNAALAVAGAILLVAGVALLVLPGPGLLLVLAGMIVLARAFPRLERHVEPVRARAIQAAEDSVTSRWRLAGSVLTGAVLVGAGVVWGLMPDLPSGGWPTGAALILSGVLLFALLVQSYRRVRGRADAPDR
ncbi:PGPGW domain-containing protein [Streptomyces sp.]|uniref:PGPGW domain-containing protein n=1 Tax=Streptomyces sp. TaxID=1931 RepID=UPI002F407424